MSRRSRLMYALGGLLVGLLVVPPGVAVAKEILDVRVINTAAQAVPVAAGGEPVVLRLSDFCSEDGDIYTVPEGKRLVIEDVAGTVTVPTDERRSTLLLVDDPATAQSPFVWSLPQTLQFQQSTIDVYVSHESVKTYARSGWKVEARIGGCFGANQNAGGMGLTISGYLIPAI